MESLRIVSSPYSSVLFNFQRSRGRNHCFLAASDGSDDRMYALFWVPLPPVIIITHNPVIIIVQGANMHDP
jgi:hypothetical protein